MNILWMHAIKSEMGKMLYCNYFLKFSLIIFFILILIYRACDTSKCDKAKISRVEYGMYGHADNACPNFSTTMRCH